jgi:hypothetical protein
MGHYDGAQLTRWSRPLARSGAELSQSSKKVSTLPRGKLPLALVQGALQRRQLIRFEFVIGDNDALQ